MSPAKTRTRSYRAMANVAPNGVGMVYDQVAELEETDEVKAMVERELLESASAVKAPEGEGTGESG